MTQLQAPTSSAAVDEMDSDLVADFLRTTSNLIDVLQREIDMLRQMRPREMQMLQEDKIVLAAKYESLVKRLAAEPDVIDAMDDDLRARFREVQQKFQGVLDQNERALRAAKQATDGMLQAFADAVEKQTKPAGYSADGQHRASNPTAPNALSIDQRF